MFKTAYKRYRKSASKQAIAELIKIRSVFTGFYLRVITSQYVEFISR